MLIDTGNLFFPFGPFVFVVCDSVRHVKKLSEIIVVGGFKLVFICGRIKS